MSKFDIDKFAIIDRTPASQMILDAKALAAARWGQHF